MNVGALGERSDEHLPRHVADLANSRLTSFGRAPKASRPKSAFSRELASTGGPGAGGSAGIGTRLAKPHGAEFLRAMPL